MNGLIGFLKALYYKNKLFFIIAVLVILAFVLVACSSGSSSGYATGPSGPVGGGC